MNPVDENIKREESGSVDGPVSMNPYVEPPQSEPAFSEPIYSEPAYSAPVYNAPVYSEPNYNGQSYSEPVYNQPNYSGQVYREPVPVEPVYSDPNYAGQNYYENAYSNQVYSEPQEAQWNMYSPGICVDQPYPRPRVNGFARSGTVPEQSRKSGFLLRAACLVVICALFSAVASYLVMDFRFNRGDFTINNQVVLGGVHADARPDGAAPVARVTDGMTASDIYDISLTQVVGIITEAPGYFGPSGSQGIMIPVSGSGFIISSDGYILTNYHVIELADQNRLPLSVVLYDGTTYDAEIIGFEAGNDVAIIKIDAVGLNPAIIGDSDKIRVGQTVYAIGNPFGDLVYTMTDGIISALDRVVSVEGKTISAFQFSAAVNRGNSGGPVYSTDGEVIGIVTAKVVRGNVEGIGFAIPINDAMAIATELIEHGYLTGRPLIGITGQTVSPGHAEYYDWAVVGVYIRAVNPGSAADVTGLEIGDIIIAIGDKEIDSLQALHQALLNYHAGDSTMITIWRNNESIVLPITFDENMHAGRPRRNTDERPESPDPFENLP